MTDDRLPLAELMAKTGDGDFLRSVAESVLQIIMEADVEGLKLGACYAEHDVLAYMTFPEQHRVKLHSTNPLERLNKEVKRRADVVGIFPNEDSITRLIGAVLLEQNDEYQLQCRYMQLEGMATLATPQIEEVPPLQITPKAA